METYDYNFDSKIQIKTWENIKKEELVDVYVKYKDPLSGID